jgi:hypothetical protein
MMRVDQDLRRCLPASRLRRSKISWSELPTDEVVAVRPIPTHSIAQGLATVKWFECGQNQWGPACSAPRARDGPSARSHGDRSPTTNLSPRILGQTQTTSVSPRKPFVSFAVRRPSLPFAPGVPQPASRSTPASRYVSTDQGCPSLRCRDGHRLWFQIGDDQNLSMESTKLFQKVSNPICYLACHVGFMATVTDLGRDFLDEYNGVAKHKGDCCHTHPESPPAQGTTAISIEFASHLPTPVQAAIIST